MSQDQYNDGDHNGPVDEFQNPEGQEDFQDAFVDESEIYEEVTGEAGSAPAPDDDMDEDNEETLEIDLSNNSWSYFDQHKDSIFTIFSHPSLPMVATGGGDNTAYLWTTHTQPPRFVGELQGHTESVVCGKFTADGAFVVTGDMNGAVIVHKASKGGQKWTKTDQLEEVEEVLWISVHDKLPIFAFGAPDGSVWVYQISSSGQAEQLMSGFSHTLECNNGVFLNSDDENDVHLLTVSEDGLVVSWNAYTGSVDFKLLPHDDFKGVESPWVSAKQFKNVVAIGARDGQLAIVRLDMGKLVHSVKAIDKVDDVADLSIEALAWSKNATVPILAVGLVSGDVLLFETLQWRVRHKIKVDDTITKLEFVGDSPILVGSSMNGAVYKWDARTGLQLFKGVGHNMGVLDFALVEGGKKIVTAGDEGVSLVFNTEE